jgi:hypothetical protein
LNAVTQCTKQVNVSAGCLPDNHNLFADWDQKFLGRAVPRTLTQASQRVQCADVELILGSSSGDFSTEASEAAAAGSSSSSSSSCCSDEPRPSSPGGSFTQFSGSTADLSSLAALCQREPHQCLTADGWKLHLMHVYDPSAEASTSGRHDSSSDSRRPQHPVLMIPGLASSAEHTFDLMPEYSLVNALVAKGYDVWMADLRGAHRPGHTDTATTCKRSSGGFWYDMLSSNSSAAQVAWCQHLHACSACHDAKQSPGLMVAPACSCMMCAGLSCNSSFGLIHYSAMVELRWFVNKMVLAAHQRMPMMQNLNLHAGCWAVLQEMGAARNPAFLTGPHGGRWTTTFSKMCQLCWSMC